MFKKLKRRAKNKQWMIIMLMKVTDGNQLKSFCYVDIALLSPVSLLFDKM